MEEEDVGQFKDREVKKNAKKLATLIRSANHVIVFTGAGISTSAGIPDFRGPEGVRTLAEKGLAPKMGVATINALATTTHMSVAKLIERGYVKYLISQNVDGLHRKSGIHPDKMSELHGNNTLERCPLCNKEYIRDFKCIGFINKEGKVDHRTLRKCAVPGCNGELVDSIINFGENLPEIPLDRAWENTKQADLCIVLGSSLTVTPAADMPKYVAKQKGANLVICNIGETALDKHAKFCVVASCDDLMEHVMKELDLEIPPFVIERRLQIEIVTTGWMFKTTTLTFNGIDIDGTPLSFLRGIELRKKDSEKTLDVSIEEPFCFEINPKDRLTVLLCFMGNYNEPALTWDLPVSATKLLLQILYTPITGQFTVNVLE